jgi:hypothetical protein
MRRVADAAPFCFHKSASNAWRGSSVHRNQVLIHSLLNIVFIVPIEEILDLFGVGRYLLVTSFTKTHHGKFVMLQIVTRKINM